MFTGIVEGMGTVARLLRRGGGARLEVRAPEVISSLTIGDSVAVNGACVTVTEFNEESFACDLVPETVARTNLGILQVGEQVNLERPLRAGDRFGGHIVQGHVDCVGLVRSRRKVGAQEMLEVTVPFELTRYLAPQGSVSLDGVSLTVVGVDRDRFRVALIPHTVAMTTLGQKGQGASVNVEVDVLSKYVERHMAARAARAAFLFDEPKEKHEPEPALGSPARPATSATKPALRPAGKPAPGPSKPAAKAPAKKLAPHKAGGSRRSSSRRRPTRTAAKKPAAKRTAAAAKRGGAKRPTPKRTVRRAAKPSRRR